MTPRPASLIVTLLVLGLAGLLAGCAASPAATVAPPAIKVLAPLDGTEVAGTELKVQVETTGLKLVNPSNTLVPGEGHVHFTLDGQPFKMSVSPDYVFTDVTPGPHTLKAELVQNDTKSFDPPVAQTVTFRVR
jgi:hypothetical protein